MTENQWDKIAEVYHKGIGKHGDRLHQKFIDPLILSYLKGTTKGSILDAGCGNGYLLPKLAPFAKRLVGIDYSKTLLTFAKEMTKPHKQIDVLHGNLTKKLPFKNGVFEVVIANSVLQYLPVLDVFASESARVLKKSGALVVIIDHPGQALYLRAQELLGKKNPRFFQLSSYFKTEMRTKKSLLGDSTLEYFHRPLKEYLNPFTKYYQLVDMEENSEDGECPRILGLKWIKR